MKLVDRTLIFFRGLMRHMSLQDLWAHESSWDHD